jgi:hypothetical protein
MMEEWNTGDKNGENPFKVVLFPLDPMFQHSTLPILQL